jgi:hypothetical protein
MVVRVGATAHRTLKRNDAPPFNFPPSTLKININLTINSIYLTLKMQYDIPSSSPPHEASGSWNTPKRARVRQMRRNGKT